MKGRIVVVREYGKPFEIHEYPVPETEPGAVLLRMVHAGICGSDLHITRAERTDKVPQAGRVMGHEGFGRVERLGEGVATDSIGVPIKEGDRIVYSQMFPCYRCHLCLRGDTHICANANTRPGVPGEYPYFTGTYADFFYLPPHHPLFRVPDKLPDDLLAPVNCAMATVTQGLFEAGAREGQYIVIQGAGGLGLYATVMAKDLGAHRVIVLDRQENRLSLATEFGADHTINVDKYNTPQARFQQVKELTDGRGADMVVELVGLPELLPEGISMIGHGGTVVEIGTTLQGRTVTIDPSELRRGKRIVGSQTYRAALLPMLLEFLVKNQNKFPFHKLVSHKFPLSKVNEALDQVEWQNRQTDVIRAVLVP